MAPPSPHRIVHVPAECERADCTGRVAYALRYDLIGAPEPAFACALHRRTKRAIRVDYIETYLADAPEDVTLIDHRDDRPDPAGKGVSDGR